jgi:hypothetical protein
MQPAGMQQATAGNPGEARMPGWVTAAVVIGALLMIAGALIAVLRPALLLSPQDEVTGAVRVYAGYLFSRNLALGVALIVALRLRTWGALQGLMVLYASIQGLDAVMDAFEGRWAIVPVVVVLGVWFAAGAYRVPSGRRRANI